MASKDFVVIGETHRPHGLRGELRVDFFADSPSLLNDLDQVWLRPKSGGRPRAFEVRSWRMHQGLVLLTLVGIADRTEAENWKNMELLVRSEDLPAPADDEVFLYQLEGLDVFLRGGERLGRIEAIAVEPQELWTIVTDDGKEVLFPVAEEFVEEIDLEAGRVTIDPPPGLLDIYLGTA